MRRTVVAIGAAGVLAVGVAGTALAWPGRFEGRPGQLEVGGDSGYYIWHNDEGWHLSTTGPGPQRHFRAVIRTDGEFQDVDQVRLEEADSYEIEDGGKNLIVRFDTHGHIDNIRWRVSGGDWLQFELHVDGHPISPWNVYLGHEGVHPGGPLFRIHR